MNAYFALDTPIGPLTLVESGDALIRIDFAPCVAETTETPLLKEAATQLDAYFRRALFAFDLPLRPAGTAFQRRVWQALTEIPYGETRSYEDIAQKVDCPKGARAVGMANHRNPLPIVIPCHRVIGKSGSLTGYASGLMIKEYLLKLEARS